MTIPKASESARSAFQKLLPPDAAITTRPMFGNLSAFVNGNMFTGLFGEDLFVRVSEEDQAKIKKQGGKAFEPMAGRPMTGYVLVRPGWKKKSDAAHDWILTALAFTRKLPAKAPKTKAAKPTAVGARKPAARQAR
jgi:TfoX/Sxy family transcriptional regulator of competence genes